MRSRSVGTSSRRVEVHLDELAVAEDARTYRIAPRRHAAGHRRVHEPDAREGGRGVRPVPIRRARSEAAPDVAQLVEGRNEDLGDREAARAVDGVNGDGPRDDPSAELGLSQSGGATG